MWSTEYSLAEDTPREEDWNIPLLSVNYIQVFTTMLKVIFIVIIIIIFKKQFSKYKNIWSL